MGNALSTLGEALKTMNSIEFGRNPPMMQLSYKYVHRYGSKGIN
jgi:DNA-binding XRE family transcriptional regulator